MQKKKLQIWRGIRRRSWQSKRIFEKLSSVCSLVSFSDCNCWLWHRLPNFVKDDLVFIIVSSLMSPILVPGFLKPFSYQLPDHPQTIMLMLMSPILDPDFLKPFSSQLKDHLSGSIHDICLFVDTSTIFRFLDTKMHKPLSYQLKDHLSGSANFVAGSETWPELATNFNPSTNQTFNFKFTNLQIKLIRALTGALHLLHFYSAQQNSVTTALWQCTNATIFVRQQPN